MNVYGAVLFLHVLGAVALFAAQGIEAACVALARRAGSLGDARAPLRMLRVPARLAPAAMLTTLASGGWMMAKGWGHQAWLEAGFAGLVVLGALGWLSLRRLRPARRALDRELAMEAAVPAAVHDRLVDLTLWLRGTVGVAVLSLMTMRPQVAMAWAILGAGVAFGILGSFPSFGARSADESERSSPCVAPVRAAQRTGENR